MICNKRAYNGFDSRAKRRDHWKSALGHTFGRRVAHGYNNSAIHEDRHQVLAAEVARCPHENRYVLTRVNNHATKGNKDVTQLIDESLWQTSNILFFDKQSSCRFVSARATARPLQKYYVKDLDCSQQ